LFENFAKVLRAEVHLLRDAGQRQWPIGLLGDERLCSLDHWVARRSVILSGKITSTLRPAASQDRQSQPDEGQHSLGRFRYGCHGSSETDKCSVSLTPFRTGIIVRSVHTSSEAQLEGRGGQIVQSTIGPDLPKKGLRASVWGVGLRANRDPVDRQGDGAEHVGCMAKRAVGGGDRGNLEIHGWLEQSIQLEGAKGATCG